GDEGFEAPLRRRVPETGLPRKSRPDLAQRAQLQRRHTAIIDMIKDVEPFALLFVHLRRRIHSGEAVESDIERIEKLAARWRERAAAVRRCSEQGVYRVDADEVSAVGSDRLGQDREILEIADSMIAPAP